MEGQKTDKEKFEKVCDLGSVVARLANQGDYLSAACVLDNAPQGVNTQALYALLAVACSAEYDIRQSGSGYGRIPNHSAYELKSDDGPRERLPVKVSERTTELVDGLINYFKNKSGVYFQKAV
ncbi:hypothetical protein HY837_05130 [archaeon]|nr:hypothetical protein [archaeon]